MVSSIFRKRSHMTAFGMLHKAGCVQNFHPRQTAAPVGMRQAGRNLPQLFYSTGKPACYFRNCHTATPSSFSASDRYRDHRLPLAAASRRSRLSPHRLNSVYSRVKSFMPAPPSVPGGAPRFSGFPVCTGAHRSGRSHGGIGFRQSLPYSRALWHIPS